MLNGIPYKKKMTKEEAVKELRKCVGKQFDPELLKVFLSVIDANSSDI